MLLDTEQAVYNSYSRTDAEAATAPYPLHVLIDRAGLVRYLSWGYDSIEIRDQIRALLDEP